MKKESKGVATFNEEREILITEREQQWSIRYQQLKEYFEKHQHCNVPQKYKEGSQLGRWVSNQRQLYKKGKLAQERIDLLNQLNFDWVVKGSSWNVRYQELKEYFEQHQHCNILVGYKENPQLGSWINRQRVAYKNNKLPQEKIDLLNQLNFEWDLYGTQWQGMYQQLKEYFEQHQNCNVPQKYKEGSQLGRWVSNQRQLYKENKLSQEKIELLNQLNFNWFVVDFKWQGMYQQLKEYYEQHQNCNVTQKYKENSKLEAWVNTQRHYYKQGKLSQNKIDLLDQLNFVWDVYGDLWDVRYQQLREYYEQYQHCNVPSKCKENSSLGRWVGTQRETYKENRLSQERIDLLNELNFNWDTNESQWKEMYEQLKKYYGEYHHCNVPVRYKQNKSLGNWVATQRKNYRNNKISQERIDLLNELNFDWRN